MISRHERAFALFGVPAHRSNPRFPVGLAAAMRANAEPSAVVQAARSNPPALLCRLPPGRVPASSAGPPEWTPTPQVSLHTPRYIRMVWVPAARCVIPDRSSQPHPASAVGANPEVVIAR